MSLTALFVLLVMSPLPVPLNVRADHQTVLEQPATKPPPTLPVANGTESIWLRSPNVSPSPTHGSDGALTGDADICIIGSGITGVSAAYHLATSFSTDPPGQPVSAIILEAREFCSGATGRNGGHLTAHAYRGFRWLNKFYGEDEAIRGLAIERYTVGAILDILTKHDKVEHVDFVPGGRVILLFTSQEYDEARADYEAAKEAGIDLKDVEWLTLEQVQSRFGASYPAVIIPGNNLWPLKLVSVLYNLAADASSHFNLTLHTRTPVTSISTYTNSSSDSHGTRPRRWTLHTPRGPISCSYVLHATNAYAAHLLPWLHGPDGIVPTRGQVMAVRATTPAALGRAGFIGNEGFEYWFPRPNATAADEAGQLVVLGGGREATKDRGYEFYEVDDSVVNPEVSGVLRKFLPAVFPGKFDENVEPEMEWTGVMGYTKSREPFVGPVINPRDSESSWNYASQYISAGYTGHGMPRAFACAEAVAGMITADMAGTKWTPPEWFPLHYLTTNDVLV